MKKSFKMKTNLQTYKVLMNAEKNHMKIEYIYWNWKFKHCYLFHINANLIHQVLRKFKDKKRILQLKQAILRKRIRISLNIKIN